MAVNDAVRSLNTLVTLMSSGSAVTDGSFAECTTADLVAADIDGMPLAVFELTLTAGFSADPTAGAVINLYEQKIMTGGTNKAPGVDAGNPNDYIGSFIPDDAPATAGTAQYLRLEGVPINYLGGTYWIEWLDGGAGTAQIAATWKLDVTPYTYKPATA